MTPKYFTQKVKKNYPAIYTAYINEYFNAHNIIAFNEHSLYLLIKDSMGTYLEYDDLLHDIGITDQLTRVEFRGTTSTEIVLDFFYKYIQDNIDLIHFRLL